jgi:hypothetical protein
MVMNSHDLSNIVNLKDSREILDKVLLMRRFEKLLRRISFYKTGLYRRPILEKTLSPKSKVWVIVRNDISTEEKVCNRTGR